MWLPKSVFDLFAFSANQRAELACLKVERDLLVREVAEAQANFKWMTVQVNQLQLERQALLEKVYNVRVAAPQVLAQPNTVPDFNESIFTDLDELADAKKQTMNVLPKWGN